MPPTDALLPALAAGVLSVAQVVAAFVPQRLWPDRSIAARSAEKPTPLTPAGVFFAVWGPIYLSCLAFAGWLNWGVITGDMHAERLAIAAGWPAAGLFLGNTLWALWAPWRGIDLGSVLILAASVVAGVWALTALRGLEPLDGSAFWLGAVPLRFLTGWATAAAWVNLAGWLAGRPGEEIAHPALLNPRSPIGATALLLGLIASVTAAAWWGQSFAVSLAGAWALLGIAVKNLRADGGRSGAKPSVPNA